MLISVINDYCGLTELAHKTSVSSVVSVSSIAIVLYPARTCALMMLYSNKAFKSKVLSPCMTVASYN